MKKIGISVIFLIAGLNVHAQTLGTTVVNTTGGQANINGSTFEWNVGEPATQTNTVNGGLVTEGVLQPFWLKLESIKNNAQLTNNIGLSPTISGGVYNMTLDNINEGDLTYQVYDAAGKLVLEQSFVNINQTSFKLDIQHLAASNYYVIGTVTQNKKVFYNNFKISKQ